MEWYETWKIDYENHKLRHDENIGNVDIYELRGENIACEICYPIRNTPEVFKKFWKILQKFEYTVRNYNGETIRALLELLSIDSEERNNYTKGRTRNALDVMVESIRYLKRPVLKEKGLKIIIIVIVRDCIEGDKESEVNERLIGNEELIRYGYILEDWDVNIRFGKFYKWYKEIIPQVINYKDGTVRRYKNILYEKEELKEDESIKKIEEFKQKIKLMLHTIDHEHGWIVKKEVIEKVYDKIRGLEQLNIDETDSDDTPRSYTITETGDENEEEEAEIDEEAKELNTLYEIIMKQGYEIEKADIKRLFRLGFDCYEIIIDGFIGKYLEDQEKDDKDVQRILMQYVEKKGNISDKETDESDESDDIEEKETTKIFEEIIRVDLKRMGYNVE